MFTQTEAQKRLRALSRLATQRCGYGRTRTEVGLRMLPQYTGRLDFAVSHELRYPEGDDLVDQLLIPDAARLAEIRTPGALVHLYVSSWVGSPRYGGWELGSVLIGWMGTSKAEPVLLDSDGTVITGA